MVRDLFLWFEVKCAQNDNGIIQTTQGHISASHFCSWCAPHICIISFLAIENARKLFKALYKLSKNLLYSHPTTMWIRGYASEIDPFSRRMKECGCECGCGWGSAFRTVGMTELMGTMSSIFLSGNHLHNGKVVWVGANRCSGMRTISGVEEHNQIKSKLCWKEITSCSTFQLSLSPAFLISRTIWEAARWGHLVMQVFIRFGFTVNVQE